MWEKAIGVFPVSWPQQTDEWLFHLGDALSSHGHLPGQGTSPGENKVIIGPPDDTMHCSLRVVPDPGGIACVVFGEEATGNDDDARRWQEAAASAAAKMGKHDQDFAWHAILGPHPNAPDWRRAAPLAEQLVIGPVLLAPGGVQMRELAGYSRGRIDTPWPRYTWPIIASGSAHTYSWEFAEDLARQRTHRACALLSLLVGTCWIPRSGPAVQVPGWPPRGLAAVPQSVGSWAETGEPDGSLPADFNAYGGDNPLVIPAWVPDAWDLMDEDEGLRTAINACYEALSLEWITPPQRSCCTSPRSRASVPAGSSSAAARDVVLRQEPGADSVPP